MTSDNIIYKLDKNYDSEIFICEDDIDNVDGKVINFDAIKAGTTKVDESGNIYFWDVNYNCIRQISHI